MSKDFITPEGFRALEEELDRLFRFERRKVTAEVSAAAALGDRSENAEYIYGKKRLREIDGRIRYLSKRLDELEVVRDLPEDDSRIYFGAWVSLTDLNSNERFTYRLVGPDESDAGAGSISFKSPLGRALLGRQVGEECRVRLPKGARHLEIERISYEISHEQ